MRVELLSQLSPFDAQEQSEFSLLEHLLEHSSFQNVYGRSEQHELNIPLVCVEENRCNLYFKLVNLCKKTCFLYVQIVSGTIITWKETYMGGGELAVWLIESTSVRDGRKKLN